jgi:RNA polymerase sigma factor (TIGR02999 family)
MINQSRLVSEQASRVLVGAGSGCGILEPTYSDEPDNHLLYMPDEQSQSENHRLDPVGELTVLIEQAQDGHEEAQKRLFSQVYHELRVIAQAYMRSERAGHTLGATALVNESYLKLFGVQARSQMSYAHRHAFFKAASVAMRRILIDHARARATEKRLPGGGKRVISLDLEFAADHADPHDLIALDEAVEQLGNEDERAASIVQLRFYAGRQISEIAEMIGVSERTVKRDWEFARARLQQLLEANVSHGEV